MNLDAPRPTAARCSQVAAALALAVALGACNLVTGASDLEVATGAAGTGGAAGPVCTPACAVGQTCDAATRTCACGAGSVTEAGLCFPADPGDPAKHTQEDVCARWKTGHVAVEPSPLVASGAMCVAGTLKPAAISDTLVRLDTFRWLLGLGPVKDDPAVNPVAQRCANLEAFYDFAQMGSPHMPPATTPCYVADGGKIAGESNLAWGSNSPAQAIDQFIEDTGNETSLGHRRWIFNPPLGPVAVGYWEHGGMYGNAECLRVFGTSGGGPDRAWTAWPPPGFAPADVMGWIWSFHGSLGGIPSATVTMTSGSASTPLAIKVQTLGQGYGPDAISWTPSGWTPAVGTTYHVKVGGLAGGDVSYDVTFVTCP